MLEVTDYAALRQASGASPYEEGEEPFGYFNSTRPDLPDGAVSDWAVTGHGFGGSFANSAIPEVIESWRGGFGYAIVDTDLGVWSRSRMKGHCWSTRSVTLLLECRRRSKRIPSGARESR